MRGRLEAQPLSALLLKGAAQSVPLFRAVQWYGHADHVGGMPLRAAPLIGRQAELEELLSLAHQALRASATAGRVVAIIGDAGIGKSRLADEALEVLRQTIPNLSVIREICQGYEQTTPYAAIAKLLRLMLRASPTGDRATQTAAMLRSVEAACARLGRFAPLLGPLFNLPIL